MSLETSVSTGVLATPSTRLISLIGIATAMTPTPPGAKVQANATASLDTRRTMANVSSSALLPLLAKHRMVLASVTALARRSTTTSVSTSALSTLLASPTVSANVTATRILSTTSVSTSALLLLLAKQMVHASVPVTRRSSTTPALNPALLELPDRAGLVPAPIPTLRSRITSAPARLVSRL
jgi:hypothetical protein